MKKQAKQQNQQKSEGDRKSIPQERHRRASIVARNLMRLPPKPNK